MDTIYTNGTIVTMDDTLDAAHSEAVLVNDGIIQAVGSFKQLSSSSSSYEVRDLSGHALYPAFIDAHSHYSMVAGGYQQVDLSECTSYAEIQEEIRQFIQKSSPKPGAFINGKGYDHNQLKEQKHLTKQLLDAVTGDHPCIIQHKSGHFGVFNSLALQYFNLDHDVKEDRGEINFETGYVSESFYIDLMQKQPTASAADMMAAFAKAQELYASHGITTMQEGMMVNALKPLYQALLQAGLLKLDLVAYPSCSDAVQLEQDFSDYRQDYVNHLRLGGRKMFLDGSPQGRTAWMKHPYVKVSAEDDPNDCSSGTMSDEQVYQSILGCAKEDLQILAHCNGDAAARQYINCMERIEQAYPDYGKKHRPVIIHAQLLDVNDLDEVKQTGMMPSFFVSHVYYWGDVHIKNFGMDRAKYISPVKSTCSRGIPFTFHCDTPVIDPDMLECVWCAVNRITKDGVVLGKAEEGIDVRSALKAVTINAAYQYHEEASKGTIAPHKRADLVILDRDPLQIDPMDLKTIKILETIKDGSTVYTK